MYVETASLGTTLLRLWLPLKMMNQRTLVSDWTNFSPDNFWQHSIQKESSLRPFQSQQLYRNFITIFNDFVGALAVGAEVGACKLYAPIFRMISTEVIFSPGNYRDLLRRTSVVHESDLFWIFHVHSAKYLPINPSSPHYFCQSSFTLCNLNLNTLFSHKRIKSLSWLHTIHPSRRNGIRSSKIRMRKILARVWGNQWWRWESRLHFIIYMRRCITPLVAEPTWNAFVLL